MDDLLYNKLNEIMKAKRSTDISSSASENVTDALINTNNFESENKESEITSDTTISTPSAPQSFDTSTTLLAQNNKRNSNENKQRNLTKAQKKAQKRAQNKIKNPEEPHSKKDNNPLINSKNSKKKYVEIKNIFKDHINCFMEKHINSKKLILIFMILFTVTYIASSIILVFFSASWIEDRALYHLVIAAKRLFLTSLIGLFISSFIAIAIGIHDEKKFKKELISYSKIELEELKNLLHQIYGRNYFMTKLTQLIKYYSEDINAEEEAIKDRYKKLAKYASTVILSMGAFAAKSIQIILDNYDVQKNDLKEMMTIMEFLLENIGILALFIFLFSFFSILFVYVTKNIIRLSNVFNEQKLDEKKYILSRLKHLYVKHLIE